MLASDLKPSLDRPFALPSRELASVVLDLPVPPSVNRTRRINWASIKKVNAWKVAADALVLAAKRRAVNPLKLTKIPRFEITVTLSEAHTRIELDNALKCLIDFLRRIELIEDDAQANMRRLVVEWGHAPEGCRVQVVELAA